jgi:signal transduction histidine kinase
MGDPRTNSQSSTQDLLSKVSRYEALFELTGVINAAASIEAVGDVLAQRLKYIADAFAWRYICFDGDPEDSESPEPTAIVIDTLRGRAEVTRTTQATLSDLEMRLWRERKTRLLCGKQVTDALDQLPGNFERDDLEQISINVLFENNKTQALYLFARRRQPFTDLDLKCLAMVGGFFHTKVHNLWEQQKLRDLELAYLQQEVMLRQSERLATLGRLSAGMAHELNNPAAVARQGAEQLKTSISRLELSQYALGQANLSNEQQRVVAELEVEAERRVKTPSELDPITRSDLEQDVEDWLDQHGVTDPWEHASTLVGMGLCATELGELTKSFDEAQTPIVIDYFGSKFTAYTLLEEIGHGTERIAEIVKALKGYSYMDQAPIQLVDVRDGLNDTLVMLTSKLREGVTVNLDFVADLPRIEAYGSELNQVWTNLIDNAIGAMDGKGTLEISARQDAGWVLVEIEDSGPGIPIDVQDKIFDPFYTTKAPGEGTGLGLSISHGIVVEKHGGQISVCSKPGATRFTIKLPVLAEKSVSTDSATTDQEGKILTA